jgi:integrase
MRLNELAIRSLKAPAKGAVIFHDDALSGFGVRISAGGTKSFVLTHGVQRLRETIGRVGILGLHEARNEAKRRLAEYTLGKTKLQSIRWNDAVDEYFAEITPGLKARTIHGYRRHLAVHFNFGKTLLPEIGPPEIIRKLNKITDRPSERRQAFMVLHTFIGWAYRRYYFEQNPLDRMKAPPPSRARERTLTSLELQAVYNTAMDGETIFDHIVLCLITTGQRRTQIGALHDSWLHDGLITIPAAYTKHTDHTFPIGPLTREILAKTPRLDDCPYIFPALRERRVGQEATVFNSWSTAKARFEKRLLEGGNKLAPWTLHDLRRTFRTHWAELGILREVAEKYIHHISGVHSGVSGIYDRYAYMPEMKSAVEKWEGYLQTLRASGN